MNIRLPLAVGCVVLVVLAASADAQVPPTPTELANYRGLHKAASIGDMKEVEATASDVNAKDSKGRTPFHIAAYQRQRGVMKALAAKGADVNALEGQAYDAVTIAAVADDVATLKVALALGNRASNVTSPYDGTALIAAAHLGHDAVVRALIEAGAPLDHVNNLGWTALIEAIVLGDGGPRHQATVRHLVEAGADRSIADRDGVTPLHHAKQRGFAELVVLLSK